jgi:heme A synthase
VRRHFQHFAWTVLGFNLLAVLWGAVVRASRSGEGCGDHWPLCNGSVIPHSAQIETLIEFAHRASVPVASLLTLAMAVWAYRVFRGELVWKGAAASLILLLTEALLGAGLVLFKYTGTDVSIGRMLYLSAHLVNTQLMIAAMALTAWWAARRAPISWSASNTTLLAIALLVSVTGAVTALSDTVFPVTSLRDGIAADFSAASPLLVRLRIWHPVVAAAAGIYIAAAAARSGRKLAAVVIGLVVLQCGAGLLNLFLLTPIWMQLIHLLLADVLWITLVLFCTEPSRALDRRPELVHT